MPVLLTYGTTGAFKGVFASGGGLDGSYGLVFGLGGDLFVNSYHSNQVLRYDGTTGAFKGVFASGGGLDGAYYLVFTTSAVPEPSTLTLALIGLIAGAEIVLRRRRARP